VTESADERGWRSLPAQIAIARARIPAGEHTIGFGATPGGQGTRFGVSGRYAVIGLRFLGGTTFAILPPALPAGKPGPEALERRSILTRSTTMRAGTF
jgi:hypothetical protein